MALVSLRVSAQTPPPAENQEDDYSTWIARTSIASETENLITRAHHRLWLPDVSLTMMVRKGPLHRSVSGTGPITMLPDFLLWADPFVQQFYGWGPALGSFDRVIYSDEGGPPTTVDSERIDYAVFLYATWQFDDGFDESRAVAIVNRARDVVDREARTAYEERERQAGIAANTPDVIVRSRYRLKMERAQAVLDGLRLLGGDVEE